MRIYLDTSGWSAVHDLRVPRSRFDGHEVLLSSCVLDELALAERLRAQQLAKYAWAVSNRQKLREHLELTAEEYRAAADPHRTVDPFDNSDPHFLRIWRSLRSADMSEPFREQVRQTMHRVKLMYRDHLTRTRRRFAPSGGPLSSDDLTKEWSTMLEQLEDEGWIGQMLEQLLKQESLAIHYSPSQSYRDLTCTACWVQYFLALAFLAAYASRSSGRPDLGDQVDFRHACYAGLADMFVTDDSGMHGILTKMVPACRARVLTPVGLRARL